MESKYKTGIWIDYDKAFIIQSSETEDSITKIDSNIEHFNIHGGAGSSTAYGPQDNVSESKLLARNLHQQEKFYSEVIETINPENKLVIFGPAEAKLGLKKSLSTHSAFKNKTVFTETADSMSENQMKAWLKAYSF